MIGLEGIVQGKGVHVDHQWRCAGFQEQCLLRLDQLALGGDEEHAHVETIAVGVQHLKVQLHGVHVEGHVLFCLPAHQLTCLLLLDPFHLNLLDDDVAAAHRSHELRRLQTGCDERLPDGVDHNPVIHDLTLDDGRIVERGDDDLDQFRGGAAVVNDHGLDEPGADVEPDADFLPAEKRHGDGGYAVSFIRAPRSFSGTRRIVLLEPACHP